MYPYLVLQLTSLSPSLFTASFETHTYGALPCHIGQYLAGAGATFGLSVSMIVSVIMAAVLPPDTAELPNPPNPGAFLPCLSASLRACCNSFALRRISALASRS